MENKIGLIKEKINALPFESSVLAGQAASFFVSLCLSNARLFGGVSPFAPAYASAVRGDRILAAFAGACCGYLIRYNGVETVRLIAVMVAVSAINYLISKSKTVRFSVYTAPFSAGGCLLLAGLTVLGAQGFSFDGLIIYLCESIIGAGSAYFLERFTSADKLLRQREPLSQRQTAGLLVSACILLLSLESIQLAGISFARILAVMLILVSAKWLGLNGGAVCGGSMGFAMSIGGSTAFLGGAYTFGGLLAGILCPFGTLAQASGFAVANAVAVMMNSGSAEVLPALYEAAIATVAFVLLPKKLFSAGEVYFAGRQKLPELETMKKALLLRLDGVKGGLEEVATAMKQITEGIDKLDGQAGENETKQLVRDQFSTLAMAIGDVAGQLGGETSFDTAAAARVKSVLTAFGIKPREVVCCSVDGISRIEITADKIRGGISRAALIGDMENACGCKLNSPTIRESESTTELTFVEKPKMNLRIGRAQFTSNTSGLCGDSCDCFLDKAGRQIVVVSDGMGTGPRAAVDGAVASWLFAKLLIAGLNFESALRLSNSALIVKSQEESLATIDALRIDMHSGKTEFFKAGAGISMICKGRKIYTFGEPSMPLGILREIEFDKSETTLRSGDILLVMSDGVSTAAYSSVADELRSYSKNDPSELAERVVEIAKSCCTDKHIDDITVVAIIAG